MGALALITGMAVLGAYILLAGPTFFWLDSSELTAAAWGLGVAHSPGHPLHSLVGRLFCWLPVGTISFRVTLASATAAAGLTALVTVISAQILSRLPQAERVPTWIRPTAAALAALTAGLSYSVAFQAVRTEVYALNLVVLAGAAALLLQWDQSHDRRFLLGAALVTGLGLCNHHLLVILALPAFLGFIAARRRLAPRVRRVVLLVLVAGLFGLTALAYLPLRAARLPEANWGKPDTVERFFWVVSAKAFQRPPRSVAAKEPHQRAQGAAFAVLSGLGPPGALLALGGLYLLWRRRQTRRAALLLSGVVGLNLVSPFFVGFDPLNPDAHGYLAVAVSFLAPALAVFVAVVLEAMSRRRVLVALGGAAACALPLSQALFSLPKCDLRGHVAAEETALAVFRQPPGALVLTSYFETIFNAWAARAALDLRPDLAIVHRNFLGQPGYVEQVAQRHPWLAATAQRWQRRGVVVPQDLAALAARRPVRLEYDLNLNPAVVMDLQPAGLAQAYQPGPVAPRTLSRHLAEVTRWEHALALTGSVDPETRRSAVWFHYLLAHFACARDIHPLLDLHLNHALQLAPQDAQLAALAARCRPPARTIH